MTHLISSIESRQCLRYDLTPFPRLFVPSPALEMYYELLVLNPIRHFAALVVVAS